MKDINEELLLKNAKDSGIELGAKDANHQTHHQNMGKEEENEKERQVHEEKSEECAVQQNLHNANANDEVLKQ